MARLDDHSDLHDVLFHNVAPLPHKRNVLVNFRTFFGNLLSVAVHLRFYYKRNKSSLGYGLQNASFHIELKMRP